MKINHFFDNVFKLDFAHFFKKNICNNFIIFVFTAIHIQIKT